MMLASQILLFITALVLSYGFNRLYIHLALKKGLVDHPNHRSMHTSLIPRGAGIVIIALWLSYLACYVYGAHQSVGMVDWRTVYFSVSVLALAVMGAIDDYFGLSAKWRLLIQFLVTVFALQAMHLFYWSELGVWAIVIDVLLVGCVLWSINLFNFMDGMDGFASVEAIFVLLFGVFAFNYAGAIGAVTSLLVLIALILGFLCWNLPPAKVFLGDSGSTALGFILAIISLAAVKQHHLSILPWLIVYSAFLFDATLTLLRRVLAGHTWHEAHNFHAYQRLCLAGYSPVVVLLQLVLTNSILLLLATLALLHPGFSYWALSMAVLLLALIYFKVEIISPMRIKIG